jgi:hypothetical protein
MPAKTEADLLKGIAKAEKTVREIRRTAADLDRRISALEAKKEAGQ